MTRPAGYVVPCSGCGNPLPVASAKPRVAWCPTCWLDHHAAREKRQENARAARARHT